MKRARGKWLRGLTGLLAAGLLTAGGIWTSLQLPYKAFEAETFVKFDRGAGTPGMARALEHAGVIRWAWQFWLERALNPSARLTAGEYKFDGAASVSAVFSRIARGDVYFFDFTVPEGSNIFDIARLAEAAGAMRSEDFLAAARSPGAILDLDPQARSLEGYLFPATYRLSHSTTAVELCQVMTTQFRRQWRKLAARQNAVPPADPHKIVALASLVEKETARSDERPLIAGVFLNRIKMNMRLECDPTTIYAALLDGRYRGTIYRSDLESKNPYNTYQNLGLPPGPIANPGADSLAAALHPAQTNFLYFVAKPEGGSHHFSATLAEHEQAVRAYRHGSQEHAIQPPKPATKTAPKA